VSAVLQVEKLRKEFGGRGGFLRKKSPPNVAVDDVSFEVEEGGTLALVGESGSGKSTVALMALGLLAPTSGRVLFRGQPVVGLDSKEQLAVRRNIQVVFQDPYGSLNGRMTVREMLTEGMIIHRLGSSAKEREARAQALLADAIHTSSRGAKGSASPSRAPSPSSRSFSSSTSRRRRWTSRCRARS
jgi:ABC-type microcin C transport system duplicated ATPase subunit YejF